MRPCAATRRRARAAPPRAGAEARRVVRVSPDCPVKFAPRRVGGRRGRGAWDVPLAALMGLAASRDGTARGDVSTPPATPAARVGRILLPWVAEIGPPPRAMAETR